MSEEMQLVIRPFRDVIRSRGLDFDASRTAQLSEETYESYRNDAMRLLAQVVSFADLSGKLLSDHANYEIVFPPEILDGKLGSTRGGLRTANIHGSDGTFIGQANLRELPSEFVASVNQLAIQIAMVEVLDRIATIDEKVTDLLAGQRSDRIADVLDGIGNYQQALSLSDPEERRHRLRHAIDKLNEGRSKLMLALQGDLTELDGMPTTLLESIFPKKDPRVAWNRADEMRRALQAVFVATDFLAFAYQELGQVDVIPVCFRQIEPVISAVRDRQDAINSWLPNEDFWRRLLPQLVERASVTCNQLRAISDRTMPVRIAISPDDVENLLERSNANLQR